MTRPTVRESHCHAADGRRLPGPQAVRTVSA
jgi:hypothetical protein